MKEMVGRVLEEETMESDKGGFSSEISIFYADGHAIVVIITILQMVQGSS